MPNPDYMAHPDRISDLMKRQQKPKPTEEEIEQTFSPSSQGMPGTTAGQPQPEINEEGPGRVAKGRKKRGATTPPDSEDVDPEAS